MSPKYHISFDEPFIRVHTTGILDFVKVFDMWEGIAAACKNHNCFKVLGHSSLDQTLVSMDAYDHMSIFETVGITSRHRIAWVAENAALIEQLRAAEVVFGKRASLNFRIFETVAEGQRWLEARNSH